MISKREKRLRQVIKSEFVRLNNRMVEEAVALIEEKDIPDALDNFERALESTWEAYVKCN